MAKKTKKTMRSKVKRRHGQIEDGLFFAEMMEGEKGATIDEQMQAANRLPLGKATWDEPEKWACKELAKRAGGEAWLAKDPLPPPPNAFTPASLEYNLAAVGFVRLNRRDLADQRRPRLSGGELTPFNERG